MPVRDILKMGDPRLLRIAPPVTEFDTPELHQLVADMFDTMRAANGAGLAAPQIGVDLQLVIFGTDAPHPRYPQAPPPPPTPRSPGAPRGPPRFCPTRVTPPGGKGKKGGGKGSLPAPALRPVVP